MGSRLEEIAARLEHEPCCDHSGRDETGNCWECRDTGCAHPPYVEDQAKEDLAALLEFAIAVQAAEKEWRRVGGPACMDDVRFRVAVLAARRALTEGEKP